MMIDLRREMVGLSAAEKFELFYLLWESLEADTPMRTDGQRAALDFRMTR